MSEHLRAMFNVKSLQVDLVIEGDEIMTALYIQITLHLGLSLSVSWLLMTWK